MKNIYAYLNYFQLIGIMPLLLLWILIVVNILFLSNNIIMQSFQEFSKTNINDQVYILYLTAAKKLTFTFFKIFRIIISVFFFFIRQQTLLLIK